MKGTTGIPVRLKYTKYGKVRWIGHRDVARAMERAFRVAELPLAFSEGFSPHPKVSFGLALSTGHESNGEYLDLVLVDDIDLDALPGSLSEALPDGLAVVGAAYLEDRAPALQEAVTAVEWHATVAGATGEPVEPAALQEAVDRAMASSELTARRRRKGREVVEDVRPVIRRIDVHHDVTSAFGAERIEMELNTQPRGAKPDEVMTAIASATGGTFTCVQARRTHQWIERDGARQEPLDADTRPCAPEARASMREGIDVRPEPSRGRDAERTVGGAADGIGSRGIGTGGIGSGGIGAPGGCCYRE